MGRLYEDTEDYETDTLLKEISDSLGKQISKELDGRPEEDSYKKIEWKEEGKKAEKKPKKKKGKVLKAVGISVAALAILIVFAGYYFLGRINYESEKDVVIDIDENGNEVTADSLEDIVPSDKDIINILLIGEEAIKDSTRGRADVMMVLTINQKYDRLVLTSFLRDSYVMPPGYSSSCKLNEVYNKGGGPLLIATIEQSFQVQIDGYARVNFESFEAIIDLLGGVEIELTADEASYLNRTNYISDVSNRKVVPGVQTLNGNQALGFTRIRKVAGINGEHDDFARTNRQRMVIQAIFDKYKSKNMFELVGVTNQILPFITTNMTKTEILGYLACAAGMLGKADLETFRVPMNNAYSDEKINNKLVLVVDFDKVNAALQEEMYGEGYLTEEEKKALEESQGAGENSTAP